MEAFIFHFVNNQHTNHSEMEQYQRQDYQYKIEP